MGQLGSFPTILGFTPHIFLGFSEKCPANLGEVLAGRTSLRRPYGLRIGFHATGKVGKQLMVRTKGTVTTKDLTPWKFNIAPEKCWLEDYSPFGLVYLLICTSPKNPDPSRIE